MESAETLLRAPEVVPVRIHCEAEDCNALLEVSVNVHHAYENPAIVRCGRCRRLLEVNLSQAIAPSHSTAYSTEQSSFYPQGHSSFSWAETVSTGFGKRHGSATLTINQPPVLVPSRDARIQYNSEVLCKERDILNVYNIQKPRPLSRLSAKQLAAALKSEASAQTMTSLDDIRPTLLAKGLLKTKNKKYKSHKMKKPSAYNIFMRRELKEVIAANPLLDHREAFKIAAGNWMRSPNSCAKHKLSVESVSMKPHQSSHNVEDSSESEDQANSLEKCRKQLDTASPSATDESGLRIDSDGDRNSCSMIDLLMRRDSVSDAAKES